MWRKGRKVRNRGFTLLGERIDLFTFRLSLCNTALCSGFVGHSRPVSGREEVIPRGVSTTAQISVSEKPGIIVRDTFVGARNPINVRL